MNLYRNANIMVAFELRLLTARNVRLLCFVKKNVIPLSRMTGLSVFSSYSSSFWLNLGPNINS